MEVLKTDDFGMPTRFRMKRPDNWHGHVRQGDRMRAVVGASAKDYGRMTIMPNNGPIKTVAEALVYRQEIIDALIDQGFDLEKAERFPQMTLYLHADTSPADVEQAVRSGKIIGAKFYPKNNKGQGTTGSGDGVPTLFDLNPDTLKAMEDRGLPLLLHGDSVNVETDQFLNLERFFIEEQLREIVDMYPELNVCLEHISTKEGVWFVQGSGPKITGTITPQHLMYTLDSLFQGGNRPHRFCLPGYKLQEDQDALIRAATSGNVKFCAGDDTAPHAEHGPKGQAKLADCGCAGAYVAPISIPAYTQVFAQAQALDDSFEQFMSINGATTRGLPVNEDTIVIEKCDWVVPESFDFGGDKVVPLCAGETLEWRVVEEE